MRIQLSARARWIGLAALGLIGLAACTLPLWLTPWVGARVRSMARARGFEAHWSAFQLAWPTTVRVRQLTVQRANGDTVLFAQQFEGRARLGSLFLLHPSIASATLVGARVRLPRASSPEDTVASGPADAIETPALGDVAPRIRNMAQQLASLVLVPARRLPELHLTDVQILRGDSASVQLAALSIEHRAGAVELAMAGTLPREQAGAPFDAVLHWAADDRLTGRAQVSVSEEGHTQATPVVLSVDGRVTQDRQAGQLVIAPGTRVTLGELAMRVQGHTDKHGPTFSLAVAMDSLTGPRVQHSLPRAVLGPLANLSVLGSWDWHVSFDLDLAQPDSVRYTADVIPHGLALDPAASGLRLNGLQEPFLATIHLPHDRIVHRDLSPTNPHYRPLDDISEYLRYAVVTNEDGGFFWHRGFNTEAIQLAVAANLRAGSYKRGAGTITMQLARNLFLGHQRTLSRKGQEVVLAWILEHLVGVPKERLLELYLNLIEWGPEVHGADEAAQFYFAKDAADLDLPQALFLTIVIPSPSKWRWRLDERGELRPSARAQMHFIGRKMQAKGWLGPDELPGADSLQITLRGAAAAEFAPRDTSAAAAVPAAGMLAP